MEETFAPADTLDRTALKRLARRSDLRGALRFAGHLTLLVGTGTAIWLAQRSAWLAPALLAQGIVLAFLFAPLHETIHRTAFATRRFNDAVAWLCGMALLLPPGYFRAFHFAHHRYTQDPARDPELATAKSGSLPRYLWHLSGLPYWADRLSTLLRHAAGRIGEAFIPPSQRPAIVAEARILLALCVAAGAASLATGNPAVLLYWVVPALLGQPFLRLFLLAEHSGSPLVPDMLRNSRTTHSNLVVRYLTWNMGYHTAHHAYPALPFHALPAAQAHLGNRCAVQAPGYLSVHRKIIAALTMN